MGAHSAEEADTVAVPAIVSMDLHGATHPDGHDLATLGDTCTVDVERGEYVSPHPDDNDTYYVQTGAPDTPHVL